MEISSVTFGRHELNSLPRMLQRYEVRTVLLVTGQQSYNKNPLRCHFESLLEGYNVWRYDAFKVNPIVEDLIQGAKIVAELKPDLIIGIGGGSVLDTAKLLRVLPHDQQQIKEILTGSQPLVENNIKLILIPTTAGSGSEATPFAIVYIGKNKYSVASHKLLPNHVLIDPALSDSMSAYLTAVTGSDALAQAIESFWSVRATEESLAYARDSISNILPHFEEAVHAPSKHARDKMMLGAYQAGKAIHITKTTAPHALSYGFTKCYGIPHGHAVMLTLPAILRLNTYEALDELSDKLSYLEYPKRIETLCQLFNQTEPEEVAVYLEKLLDNIGLERKLRAFNIPKSDLPLLVEQVNIERLDNNPVKLTRQQLLAVLESIY